MDIAKFFERKKREFSSNSLIDQAAAKKQNEDIILNMPMPKLLCNFIEVALRHGCSPVNVLHIFRTPFPKNTSGWLLLMLAEQITEGPQCWEYIKSEIRKFPIRVIFHSILLSKA